MKLIQIELENLPTRPMWSAWRWVEKNSNSLTPSPFNSEVAAASTP
jgi:hypothetical protein